MKEKLRITSLIRETVLEFRTKIGNDWFILTNDFEMLSEKEVATNIAHKGKLPIKVAFSPRQNFWDMEYDTADLPRLSVNLDDKDPSKNVLLADVERRDREISLNQRKRIAATEFLTRHIQLVNETGRDNGHKPAGMPIGKVEILTQKARVNHLSDRKKAEVFAIIDKMTWQEQYDLALYYSADPVKVAGQRRSEVLQSLIGLKGIGTEVEFKGGIMWKKFKAGVMIADDFLTNYQDNPTVVMKIYINKARAYGLLAMTEGGLYMTSGTFVGKDTDEAVVYFSKDVKSYTNYIQHEVNQRGELPEDDMGSYKQEAVPISNFERKREYGFDTEGKKQHYLSLKAELEGMGEEMPRGISGKQLEWLLVGMRADKIAKEKTAETPTKQLEVRVDPSQTTDLDALKEIMRKRQIPGWQGVKNVTVARHKIKEWEAANPDKVEATA